MRRVDIPILMYHSIADEPPRAFRRFAVAPAQFAAQMRALVANGFHTVTVGDLVEARAGRAILPPRPIVLTFDDGFADFHSSAAPILFRFGLRATLYVVAGLVGATSAWLAAGDGGAQKLASWAQLRELAANGVEIGSHTLSHPALDIMTESAARSEIAGSKRAIEDRLGRPVETFAYPYGFKSPRVRALVEEAGYASACAVAYRTSSDADDRLALPRLIVPGGMNAAAFDRLLEGAPPIATLVDRARSHTYALMRRAMAAGG
jgi:peptidoglycan/xylan/chitin deacetylase (PgdA/CDA1 family)